MMRLTVMLAALALPLAAHANAEDEQDSKKRDPNEVVCKNQKRTDTRFPTRICHTRAKWEAIAEQAKRELADSRDRPVVNGQRSN